MERLPEFIANHLFLFSLLLAILILLIWNLYGDMLSGIKMILPDEVTRLINRENAKVVDLRGQKEFANGHIIDALNISSDQLEKSLDKLAKFKENGIIFCCATGATSTKKARTLMHAGYQKVYALKGGIGSWQNANLPLTKGIK